MSFTYSEIARLIDHALLAPALDESALREGCLLAQRYAVASAMVPPHFVERAVELLADGPVFVSSTVGFPHGGQRTELKASEAQALTNLGCRELDMVVNVSRVKSGDFEYVRRDITAVLAPVRERGAKLKVIFENCYLSDAEKIRLCELSGELGVDFVKTSTGFGGGGATWADLELMRRYSPPSVAVKASGGLRDLDQVLRAFSLGATRIGTSATATILQECRRRLQVEGTYDGPDLAQGEPLPEPSGY